MDEKQRSGLGDDIKEIVQDAISSKDFSKLNKNITQTVNSAINEVREGIVASSKAISEAGKASASKETPPRVKKQMYQFQPQHSEEKPKEDRQNGRKQNVIHYHYQKPEIKKKNLPQLITPNPAGRVSGVLMTVAGSFGLTVSGIGAISFLMGGLINSSYDPWGALPFFITSGICASVALINTLLIVYGTKARARVGRFQKYVRTLHGRNWCEIEELAKSIGKDARYVVKDLKKMLEKRFFPYGRMDEEKTCLMLDQESYQQYCSAKASLEDRLRREEEEERLKEENPEYTKLTEALEEGKRYIEQIRKVNEEIPGEKISQKLYALEGIIQEIFEHLKENPDKLPEMRRFMDYYLPTTLKLVIAYQELSEAEIEGSNIINAKKEIEETLDTINEAFMKLYDSLFAEKMMDISADISVLQTMFKQEGLTDSDFSAK